MTTFSLDCDDLVPGCAATFSAGSREALLSQVADHAARAHGITEVTPEVAGAIVSRIVAA